MTAKETIENLKAILEEATETEDAVSYVTSVDAESLNLAIEALKKQTEHSQNTPQKQPDLETFGVKTGETCADAISRQAVVDVIFSEPLYETGMKKRSAEEVVPAIFEKIKALPSVHPEIVRCKDCIRYGKDNCFMKIQMLWELKPDDFCSYAERRTDGRD